MCDTPDHFSHKFELKIDRLPTKNSDRISMNILYPGLLFGFALILLGVYELFNGMAHKKTIFDDLPQSDLLQASTFITPGFFDAVVIIVGAGIIISLILSYLRYKKIIFDGKTVFVTYRPVFGEKKSYSEPLKNYEGVRLRVEFFQFGIINKNKYIIELYHKDCHKTIPLYISTKDKGIRKIWEYYARSLNKPTVMLTDEGIVYRQPQDFDKSLKELVASGQIENRPATKSAKPASIAVVKKDKIVVKCRKIIWDIYNILAWLFIIIFAGLFIFIGINEEEFEKAVDPSGLYTLYTVGIILLVAAVWVLFRKDKLVIKKDKIVHVHKFMLFSRKNDEIQKKDIEAVDVTINPASGRRYLAIISDDKTIIFGKKLPLDELRWVKNFMVNEIIK